MLNSKLRNISIGGLTAATLAASAAVPAASQALVNNFGILHSSEGFQLKAGPATGPGCQPLFPVSNPTPPNPVPPTSKVTSVGGAQQVASAQQEVQSAVGPATGLQVCEAG